MNKKETKKKQSNYGKKVRKNVIVSYLLNNCVIGNQQIRNDLFHSQLI